VGRAEADLALINGRLKAAFPKNFRDPRADARTRVTALHEHLVGNVRPVLLVLSGSVALVLLIACMNISILLLARGIARQKEIAVRTALGAGRGRVLMQLLTEGMLLALAGGVTGLALAVGGVRLLRAIAPADVPHIDSAGISGAVLAFNLALTVAAGILFGLAPIRGALRADPGEALKQTSRSASGTRGHKRIENLLVIVETAFALILLVGAGLLMRTVAGLTAIAPGFRPDDVVSARISLPYWKYPTDARQRAVMEELLEKLRFGPRVDWTGAVTCLPYGGLFMLGALEIEGRSRPSADPGSADDVAVNFAAGDYFKAMGIPVLDGRAIDGSDRMARPAVAMVNETLARRFFAGTRAVGSRIRVGGVAGDVKQGDLASEPRTEVFQAAAQGESGGSAQTLVIHSTADSRILLPWLRAEIARVDKDLPPPEIETMRAQMSSLIESQTFVMRLLALFAGVAITLAATGIYGVLTYSVERRAHEIGIRLALGAKPRQVMGLVVGRGLRLASAGAILGIAGGLGLTRYLVSLLYGVTPHDPATLAGGAVVVLMVALATSYIPARRALDQDAIASLRVE
jgi:putative ABC transport system permease protein